MKPSDIPDAITEASLNLEAFAGLALMFPRLPSRCPLCGYSHPEATWKAIADKMLCQGCGALISGIVITFTLKDGKIIDVPVWTIINEWQVAIQSQEHYR